MSILGFVRLSSPIWPDLVQTVLPRGRRELCGQNWDEGGKRVKGDNLLLIPGSGEPSQIGSNSFDRIDSRLTGILRQPVRFQPLVYLSLLYLGNWQA